MTPNDLWSLTKNNRLLVLNVIQQHTKYEICPNFPAWDIMFTRFSQFDPCWPLTSTKNNRLLVLNVVHLHTKYEICPSFPAWDIMFTRFSQFDPCWPQMTFDLHQQTKGFLYSMWYTNTLNMRYVQASLAWDIVFTRFFQDFHNLMPVDPKWPLTYTKNNRRLVLNVVHLHTKYENCPSFHSWDIVFTSRRHDTHTNTHTHTHAHTPSWM